MSVHPARHVPSLTTQTLTGRPLASTGKDTSGRPIESPGRCDIPGATLAAVPDPQEDPVSAIAPKSPQHMQALERANRVRLERAEIKRKIADAETTVAAVLRDPPPETATMELGDLIMCGHRWGRARMRRLLRSLPADITLQPEVIEAKGLGALTDRQRNRIADMLEGADPWDGWANQHGTSETGTGDEH